VVTIDTARFDRFPGSDRTPGLTPVIEALADSGTVFEKAISPAPITLVSHASLFTGQQPVAHGVRNNGTYALGEAAETLAEVLRAHSYRTGAFVGAAVLRRKYGLAQGFDTYDDRVRGHRVGFYAERRGEEVVGAALAWLSADPTTPTFLWVHLFDPHAPYAPPEPERSSFAGALYDGEIAYADRVIGDLLDGLRAQGRYERTLIVVTSDHGESLGEHMEDSHGVFVYDETQRIPLVLRAPHVETLARVEPQVELIDVMPTVLSLMGLPTPASVQGRDLAPLLTGEGTVTLRPAYLETLLPLESYGWSGLRGLRGEHWKLILGRSAEFYDLETDPGELTNLAEKMPERVDALSALLETTYPDAGRASAARLALDASTRAELEALGYLRADADAVSDAAGSGGRSRPDPRAMVRIPHRNRHALQLFARGFHDAAIEQCRRVLEDDPGNSETVQFLTRMLIATGQFEASKQQLREYMESNPDRAWPLETLAVALSLQGEAAEALDVLSRAQPMQRGRTSHRKRRWRLLLELGEWKRLHHEASQAIALDAEDGLARAMAAIERARQEAGTDLVESLSDELALLPDDPDLLSELGNAYAERGLYGQALPLLQRAQSMTVTDELQLLRLIEAMDALGRHGEIVGALRPIGPLDVLAPAVWLRLGTSCLAIGDLPCASWAMHRVSAVVPGSLDTWLRPRLGSDGPLASQLPHLLFRPRLGSDGPLASQLPHLLFLAGRYVESATLLIAGDADTADAEALFLAGRALSRAGERQQALVFWERAERMSPESPSLACRSDLALARSLWAGGRSEEALALLGPAHRRCGPTLESSLAYAEAALGKGQFPDAVRALSQLAELLSEVDGDPARLAESGGDRNSLRMDAAAALARMGDRHWELGRFEDAFQAYALGGFLMGSDAGFFYNTGLCLERMGLYAEAILAFERALSIDPQLSRARKHIAALSANLGLEPPAAN
jgi:arylsulfatase A-like enzyme/Tfp pilus assembly protein PilF